MRKEFNSLDHVTNENRHLSFWEKNIIVWNYKTLIFAVFDEIKCE